MHLSEIVIQNQLQHVNIYGQELLPWFNKGRIAHMLVPDDVLKNVLFIGTKQDGTFIPRGTGFIIIYEEHGHQFMHLVTAEHVISNIIKHGWEIWCRANLTRRCARISYRRRWMDISSGSGYDRCGRLSIQSSCL
jgi:hypothetical protein